MSEPKTYNSLNRNRLVKIPSEKTIWHIAAIGLGLIISIAVIFILQFLNFLLYPSSNKIDINQTYEYSLFVANHPIFLSGNLLSNLIGCFLGSAIAVLVRPDLTITKSMSVGAVLLILSMVNIIMIPHPSWFVILTILLYLPFSYLGATFIKQQLDKHSSQ